MKYFSTFTGIAGFELGIRQAYEERNNNLGRTSKTSNSKNRRDKSNTNNSDGNGGRTNSTCIDKSENISNTKGEKQGRSKKDSSNTKFKQLGSQQPTCVGYSEVNKYAIQIYKKHFPKHKNYGDITKIIASEVPDHDLFIGGFPCQSFSIAGKRGGFKDTRGTLFFDIARILKVKRPKNFILENVKGLLNHDKGNTFATIISTINELEYDCQWNVLNSKNFGVPQNRERVFIVGHLRGVARPKVFPITQSSQGNLKYSAGVISAREKWKIDVAYLSISL